VLASSVVLASPAAASGGSGFAGASGDAGTSGLFSAGPTPTPAAPPPGTPGIDVSHHQDVIDWAQVAASGVRFAIAKATEGQTYVDPMYAANKAGAQANGIAFTAYHFARPDAEPNDAILEADHFVDVAQLLPGNLVPALDIERTGGLTQAELTQWILTWLGRVTERLGVRPMVYTSPNGWANRTGDTTAVADAGYTVLWVAHWDVSAPTLPANGWRGYGWTFWQYGNCGAVPGIVGCVDTDVFAGSSFEPVSIPSPDLVPPTATFAVPTEIDGSVTVAFSEVVHQVTPDNLYIWSPVSGTYPEISLTCRSGKGIEVGCVSGNVRTVDVRPLGPLVVAESYQAVVNPAIVPVAVVDRSGNPAPTSTQDFATPSSVEQDSPAVVYAWREVSRPQAFGRSYAVEHRAGASASFAFEGRLVTWYTATGPAQGRAAVWIDGRRVGVVDGYAPRGDLRVARTFRGLERGEHTITVRVLGLRSPAATDTMVVVDAFEAGGDLVKSPTPDAGWGTRDGVSASDLARSNAELTFQGNGIEWTTVRGPDQGRAAIWLDGMLVRVVDGFAPKRTPRVVRTLGGLADGVHTLRIVVTGEARPAATGTLVSIDRFAVRP
jgi:GH25 family lysozyme M1 (1,4-beta-N-acetylmuramidase)